MAETTEDPMADDTGEDHMVETGEDFAAGTGNTAAAETGNAFVVETGEDSAAGTGEDPPVAEIREDQPAMVDFENPPELVNGGVEGAAAAASSFSGSFQMFAAEAADYSRKSLESGSAFIAKVRRAKSLESAIQIQSDYAKSAYTEFVAYLVKMSDLYCNLFKRGSTPTEKAAAKIESVKA